MNTLVGLAGIRLPTLASHDRKSLTECVVLQASPGVVGCIERLVFTRQKEGGERDATDYTLEDRIEWRSSSRYECGTQGGLATAIDEIEGLTARSSRRKGGVEGTSMKMESMAGLGCV